MATFKSFEEIAAWQKARQLTKEIYLVTASGKFAKDYDLRNQIRQASVSIMSNIAEGFERDGSSEFNHFLSVAKGSAGEVRSQLYVAIDQNYLEASGFDMLLNRTIEVSRIISGLMSYLRRSDIRGTKFKRR